MNVNIEELREDYQAKPLLEEDVHADPFQQFQFWFKQALAHDLPEPNAMVLATVGPDGRPSARVVLLKGMDEESFHFYSNYQSRKGQDLAHNPNAALVFNWLKLHRQVRIEGEVLRMSESESRAYFQKRPKGSQIGAWASPQSRVIPDRRYLEARREELERQYADDPVLPLPENWGGYRVKPRAIEFWQGRTSRLHDRLRYEKDEQGQWQIRRLAP